MLTKASSHILSNSKEKQRDCHSTKERNDYSEGVNIQEGLNKHLLSPGISFNTLTYLKWRRKSHLTWHLLLFFGSSSFPAEGHPCCLSLRKGQTAKEEGEKASSGKATERRIKRDQVRQLEGMGRKAECLSIAGQKGW